MQSLFARTRQSSALPGSILLLLLSTLAIRLLSPLPVSADSGWQHECIECPRHIAETSNRALAFNGDGLPVAAYGGDHLYLAIGDRADPQDGEMEWAVQTVDGSTGVGLYASMAIDPQDEIHITYLDTRSARVKYAVGHEQIWSIETIGPASARPRTTSLILDAHGMPHVAWIGPDGIMFARRDEAWSVSCVAQVDAHDVSLALDSQGRPHVSYVVVGTGLHHAWRDANWHTESVDSAIWDAVRHVQHSAIAVGPEDCVMIAYCVDDEYVKLAQQSAAGWTISTVYAEPYSFIVHHPTLVLDDLGYPHIGYGSGSEIQLAHWDGQAWTHDPTFWAGNTYYGVSIAASADGEWYALGSTPTAEMYVWKGTVEWKYYPVDYTTTAVGAVPSIAQGPDGRLHAAYLNKNGSRLHQASQVEDGWQVQEIDRPWWNWYDWSNTNTSIAVASDGSLRICYGWSGLKYAQQTDDGWVTEWLNEDDSWMIGHTSMKLDGNDMPHLSYIGGYSSLQYMTLLNGQWVETRTGFQTASMHTPLALDSSDRPFIACAAGPFWTYTRNGYVYNTGAGWEQEELPFPGSPSALALDDADVPHIAFVTEPLSNPHNEASHDTAAALGYVSRGPDGWSAETVATGAFDTVVRLALDLDGRPHILAHDVAAQRLIYAFKGRSGWRVEAVTDCFGDGQSYELAIDYQDDELYGLEHYALLIDRTGSPVIAYHHMASESLWLARKTVPREPTCFVLLPCITK